MFFKAVFVLNIFAHSALVHLFWIGVPVVVFLRWSFLLYDVLSMLLQMIRGIFRRNTLPLVVWARGIRVAFWTWCPGRGVPCCACLDFLSWVVVVRRLCFLSQYLGRPHMYIFAFLPVLGCCLRFLFVCYLGCMRIVFERLFFPYSLWVCWLMVLCWLFLVLSQSLFFAVQNLSLWCPFVGALAMVILGDSPPRQSSRGGFSCSSVPGCFCGIASIIFRGRPDSAIVAPMCWRSGGSVFAIFLVCKVRDANVSDVAFLEFPHIFGI